MEYSSNRKNKIFYDKDIEQFQQLQNEELNSTFNKLYHSLNPNCPNNYGLPQNFQNLLRRILSTNFSIMKNDESAIINSLLEKVSKSSNFNQDIINKFQYLYSLLTKKRTLTKRWGILYILNSLSKNNNYKEMNFSATNELQQNYMNMNANMQKNMLIDNCLNCSNIPGKYQGNINNNNILGMNTLNNLSPVSNINERFYDNQNLINQSNNQMNIDYEEIIVINPNKTSLKITEKDIINDLLFVFEGINGKYIAYDAAEDAYILNKLIPWSEEIYNIVNSLCEIGWLYKKIKLYLDYYKGSNIQSQFIKSFIYSIQNELNDYFKLISFLRKLNSNQNINNGKKSQNLNLKNIVLWTLVPKETLKWIAACCEALHSLKGTSVLSQIYSFVHYGGCNKYLNNILNEVSKPFINFVINWIKYGELQDPNKEFFVDILSGIKDDDIWNLQYQLIGKNVPNFMKREPTIKIFEVGKCIHFIRNYCKENYNLSNLKIILINLINKYSKLSLEKEGKKNMNENVQMDLEESSMNMNSIMNIRNNEQNQNININNAGNNLDKYDFDYGFDEDKIVFEIESYQSCLDFIEYIFDPSKQEEILNMSFMNEIIFNIDVIHKLINKDLVRIVFTKFKFLTNLNSINKYLLLGQGDMIQSLMESLFEELDKPANLIFKHNLQSNLESAIRNSNAQYNDPDCLKKLNIKLNNASVGDIGWDIFCLEYKVDLPLSIIFNTKLLKDYQKLFFFFWKIKRIEYSQNNQIWKKIKEFYQLLTNNKMDFMKKAIQIFIHFNQEIIHFISNFHNYLALEVLETQYKKLINELPKVNNLDELIVKHRHFVDNIKKQCLLDESNITINKKIANIFDIILRFKNIHDAIYNFLIEHSLENQDDNTYINQNRLKNIKDYLQQITILYKDFQNQIIELINTIKLIGKNNLEYLSLKLDYNYYYSFLEKDEEDKKNREAIKRINDQEERQKILKDPQNNNADYSISNDNDNDNDNSRNNYINNNNSRNNYSDNNNNNLGNVEEGNENVEEDEMDIDDNNDKSLEGSNNINITNNKILNSFENRNNIDNSNNSYNNNPSINNYLENSNNIFGKSSKYVSSKNKNNVHNFNDNFINNTANAFNHPSINISKDNNIKIITKKKDKKPQEIINNELNDVLNFNNNININNNINDDSRGQLNKKDLDDINMDKYKKSNSNNIYVKTQEPQKTYLYEKKNVEGPELTYNYKSMTKSKPQLNINLENVDDEDQIITTVKPKIYGVTRTKKNEDNK